MSQSTLAEIITFYPSQASISEDIQMIREAFLSQVETSHDTQRLWLRYKLLECLEHEAQLHFAAANPPAPVTVESEEQLF